MPDLRERLLYPRAGWLSLGLLVVMALALTWAVQGAEWLDQLEFLPPVALWAIVGGALLGVLPMQRGLLAPARPPSSARASCCGPSAASTTPRSARSVASARCATTSSAGRSPCCAPATRAAVAVCHRPRRAHVGDRLHGRLRRLSPQPGARRHPAARRGDDRQPVGDLHRPVRPPAAVRDRGAAALAARRARRPPGRLAAPAGEREPRGARRRSCARASSSPARASSWPGS